MRALRTRFATAGRVRLCALRGARGEEGWALVVALTLMVVMMGFGMAILAIADTQSQQSAVSRQRDAAFSVADAALNAEMFMLGNNWPGPGAAPGPSQTQPAGPYPVCTPSSTDTRCPSASMLQNLINSPDTISRGISWQINVYDDGINGQGQSLQSFYSDLYTGGQPSYDQNGDGKLWVRAQATVGNVTKAVVALVQTQQRLIPVPNAVVIAGSLQITNSGNKTMIDTQGSLPSPGSAPPVDLRCHIDPVLNPNCLQMQRPIQISPPTQQGDYTGGNAISANDQATLKAQAQANGTYYATCPANLPTGAVVWIDSGNCSFTGNTAGNGVLIINNGTLTFGGTVTFNGLVYAINSQGSSGTVITTTGSAVITGAVMVDGNGNVAVGSDKLNVSFDPSAVAGINTTSSAGYIQTTWREL